jgi:hypothetical protein
MVRWPCARASRMAAAWVRPSCNRAAYWVHSLESECRSHEPSGGPATASRATERCLSPSVARGSLTQRRFVSSSTPGRACCRRRQDLAGRCRRDSGGLRSSGKLVDTSSHPTEARDITAGVPGQCPLHGRPLQRLAQQALGCSVDLTRSQRPTGLLELPRQRLEHRLQPGWSGAREYRILRSFGDQPGVKLRQVLRSARTGYLSRSPLARGAHQSHGLQKLFSSRPFKRRVETGALRPASEKAGSRSGF